MVINIDLRIDNPAKQQIRVKIPSIRVYYSGTKIADTKINANEYVVQPMSSGTISGIKLNVSLTSLGLALITTSLLTDVKNCLQSKDMSALVNNLGFDVLAEVNGLPIKAQKLVTPTS